MPQFVPPVADERSALLAYLDQQRSALRLAVHGLSDEQAGARPAASDLCLAGLLKHAARTELRWMTVVVAGRPLPDLWPPRDWAADFRLEADETLAGMLDYYDSVAAETATIMSTVDDVGQRVADPDSPWSGRWVLLHLIEETARHAGHADLLRAAIDGTVGE